MYTDLSQYDVVAFDTETTGLQWWNDRIFGVSVSAGENDWYVDVRRDEAGLRWLRDQIPRVRKLIGHNIKFDWHFSRELGIILPEGRVECTMIRAALIDEHRFTYDLDSVAKDCIGLRKDVDVYAELAKLFGGKPTKQAQMPNLHRAPPSLVAKYAKRDTRVCLELWKWQQERLDAEGLHKVHQLETELLPVIVRMEHGGVRVDTERAERARAELGRKVKADQRRLDEIAGFPVNPNPSGSIHKLFKPKEVRDEAGNRQWQLIDGTYANVTEGGKAGIDADVLRRMTHPAAKLILDMRKAIKAKDTFLAGHVLSNHDNGIIHANINQTKSEGDVGTGTGRLSINGPALQQIPKRDKEMASIVRSVFIPDEGHQWVCNDWAQMDFRVFAHYVNDPSVVAMYVDDPSTDFHSLTAQMTGLPRSPRFAGDPNAKQINLGLVFGMGQGRLAQEMGLPFTLEPNGRGGTWVRPSPEAEQIFELYHSRVHGVRDFLRDASSVAKSRGYVRTIAGRHVRFPRGQFTHKAGGLIFQGTAADALKVKLVELDAFIRSEGSGDARLLLNVHDEFDHSIAPHRQDLRDEVNRIVTSFGPNDRIHFRVPIVTDQGVGPDWHDASK